MMKRAFLGGIWLETSPHVQRLSLLGVLEAWGRMAENSEREGLCAHR